MASCVKGLIRGDARSAALGRHRPSAQLSVHAAAVRRNLRYLGFPDCVAAPLVAGRKGGRLTLRGEGGELRKFAIEELAALEGERLPQRGTSVAAVSGNTSAARCSGGAASAVHCA